MRKTSTLLSWRPWRHRGVRRRWWRPTARCKPEKKPRCMSSNWTYSSKLCFLKKLSQCFHWGNSAKNMGTRITGKAVKIHISSTMARELIAIYQTLYHLWSLEYQRVLPQLRLHLLRHHLHHWSQHRLTEIQYRRTEVWKLHYQKELKARMKSFGETRCMNPQKTKTKIKIGNRKK